MRLDKIQKLALSVALQNLVVGDKAFLFGSRADDSKRGGDIDVLVFSQQPSFELSRKMTRDFFKQCEEKVDILVINPISMSEEQTLFVDSIDKVPLSNL